MEKKIDNKLDEQLLITQATIDANRKYYDNRMKKLTEYLKEIIAWMMHQIKVSKSSPDKKDLPKDQDHTTMVPNNNMAPPFGGGHSTK